MPEPGFERVASLSELQDGTITAAELESGESVCLVRVGDSVYAMSDRCTHAEFPLSDGEMVEDHVIECALHGAQFDVRDGRVLAEPADETLPTFEVRIEKGEVWVGPPQGAA